MKYLLVFLLLAVVVWRWRQASAVRTAPSSPRPTTTTTMVACKHCAVHVPASDAVPGRNGRFYCSPQHRHLQEP